MRIEGGQVRLPRFQRFESWGHNTIANLLETRRLHLLLDNQLAAFEEAVRARSIELREARSNWLDTTE